jgi:hypothetical protein
MTQREERLRQLRRVVEAVPDHLLHMRRFTEESPCGTAHCALGWAVVDPWFRSQGITSEVHLDGAYPFAEAARFFDLTELDTTNLFGGTLDLHEVDPHAVTKAEVLWNIDRLLACLPTRPYRATGEQVEFYAGDP